MTGSLCASLMWQDVWDNCKPSAAFVASCSWQVHVHKEFEFVCFLQVKSSIPILMCSVPGYDASSRVDDLSAELNKPMTSIAIGEYYLSRYWPRSMRSYGITKPQWDNAISYRENVMTHFTSAIQLSKWHWITSNKSLCLCMQLATKCTRLGNSAKYILFRFFYHDSDWEPFLV